jgi:transposase-like protein
MVYPVDTHRHTRRKVQRFRCRSCGGSFSLRRQKKKRYSWEFALEVARRHVEERCSYRVLAKRYRETLGVRVSPSSLQRMVGAVGKRCKSPVEVSRELDLWWRGYFLVDDKHVGIRGKDVTWYLGVDKTGDVVHAEVLKEPTVTAMGEFFRRVRDDLPYRMKGLTSDQEGIIRWAFKRVFPGKPHQLCVRHALEALDRHLGYSRARRRIKTMQRRVQALLRSLPDRRSSESARRVWEQVKQGYEQISQEKKQLKPVEILRRAIRRVLFAGTYRQALSRWANFHRHRLCRCATHRRIIDFIGGRWQQLTVHYHHRGMPRTNNIAENTMRQLERRLKTVEGFGTVASARAYLNLLIGYLRTKPLTDCRGSRRYRNGLSRLELAGATLPTHDWLKLCLKPAK